MKFTNTNFTFNNRQKEKMADIFANLALFFTITILTPLFINSQKIDVSLFLIGLIFAIVTFLISVLILK